MLFLILLLTVIMLLILGCFALIMRNRISRPLLLGIIIISFSLIAYFPFRYMVCNSFRADPVSITALGEKGPTSTGFDVTILYIDTNLSKRSLENPVEGNWAWWNGSYKWSPDWEKLGFTTTETVVMNVEVGEKRKITFVTGPNCGMATVTCLGSSQTVDLYSENDGTLSIELPNSYRVDMLWDLFLRAAAFIAISAVIIVLISSAAVIINRKTNWRILLRWKYEAIVFLLSFFNIVVLGWFPSTFSYPASCYFFPYEGGFSSRGFVCSLMFAFIGPYVRQDSLALLILLVLIFFYLFCSILVVRIAKRESDWRLGVFWVLLYLLTPFLHLQITDDARPDIYLILLFLLAVILVNCNRFVQLVPILCVAMMLINETSCAFFIFPVLALLLYFFFKDRDIGYVLSFINVLEFTSLITICFLTEGKGNLLIQSDAFFTHMTHHTNMTLERPAFDARFGDFRYLLDDYAFAMGNQFNTHYELLVSSILYFILLIPFEILLAILWKSVYRKLSAIYSRTDNAFKKEMWLYPILLISSLGGVACMLIAYDYLRFTEFILIASLAIIFTLIHKEHLNMKVSDLYLFTPPKSGIPMAPFGILIYMSFWGAIDVWPRNTEFLLKIEQFIEGIAKI